MNRKTIAALIFSVLAAAAAALRPQGAVHGASGLAPLAGLQDPLPTGCFRINIPIVMRDFGDGPAAGSSSSKYSRPMADYNGDGCADLAIGIPGKKVDGETLAGSVLVVFGSTGVWGVSPYSQLISEPDAIANDFFGYSVTHGDFNTDGFSDLVVGAATRTVLGAEGAGQVRVYYGSTAGLDETVYATFDQVGLIDFPEELDNFGRDVAAGDFNGDGYDDLVVSATGEDYQAFVNSGVIHIIFGSEDGLTTAGNIRYAQNDLFYGDLETDNWFGLHRAAGDFNGDGHDDIAVGSSFEDIDFMVNTGAVDILYGSPAGPMTSNVFIDQGMMPDSSIAILDYFGSAVAVGDFNGDGYADLGIGSWGEPANGAAFAGAAYAVYGSAGGLMFVGNQRWDQSNLPGVEEEDDLFGSSLGTGDFNRDGFDELAIGVVGENVTNQPGEDDAGAVQVLFGSSTGLTGSDSQIWTQDTPGIVGGSAPHDHFGSAFASGDYNGDGYPDLAVSAPLDDFNPGVVDDSGEVNIIYGSSAGLTADGNLRFFQSQFNIPGESETWDQFGLSIR